MRGEVTSGTDEITFYINISYRNTQIFQFVEIILDILSGSHQTESRYNL